MSFIIDKSLIAAKLRLISSEFSRLELKNLIFISPYDYGNEILGIKHIKASTIGSLIIGEVPYEAARMFEDYNPTCNDCKKLSDHGCACKNQIEDGYNICHNFTEKRN